jgi:hypothetical protein
MNPNPFEYDIRRKTVQALGTLERPTAGLDCRSIVALEWTSQWASTRGRLMPQAGVILRRALSLYVDHLSRIEDPEGTQRELEAIHRAAKGTGTARTLTEARARLEAAEGRRVAFLEVLQSPESRKLVDSIDAAVEARCGHE